VCAKNGTQRENTCRLQLSLQPRFIARFNQLVSQTAQDWESTKPRSGVEEDDEQHDIHEDNHDVVEQEPGEEHHEDEEQEGEYEEYDEDENSEEVQEYDEETVDQDENVESVTMSEIVEAEEPEPAQDTLTAAEEDELYEENDDEEEEYDPTHQSVESLVNEMDDGNDEAEQEEENYHEEYHEGEEDVQEQVNSTGIPEETEPTGQQQKGISLLYEWYLTRSDGEDSNVDEDDLISYEEAVDQTEDGHDYRQQYIEEDSKDISHDIANGNATKNGKDGGEHQTEIGGNVEVVPEEPSHSPGSPNSKRPFGDTVEVAVDDQAPRKRLCVALLTI
jgi:hypothetical protein